MYYPNAVPGLHKMFISQIGSIVCTVLLLIPVVNFFALIGVYGFLILSLVGLNEAGRDIEGCKTAFYITIVQIVLNVLSYFLGTGVLDVAISIVLCILNFLTVYYVCSSVAEALRSRSFGDIAARGELVWKINLAYYIAEILRLVLTCIPVLNVLIVPVIQLIVTIVSLVGGILYIMFLYKSYVSL